MAVITRDAGPSDVAASAPLKTRFLRQDGVYALPQGPFAPLVSALADGATIAVDASLGNVFTVTLGGNRTIANPVNPYDGQVIRFRLTQDGTGSRTVTWSAAYDFGALSAPTLTTTAAKVDILAFEYVAALGKWCYLGSGLGF